VAVTACTAGAVVIVLSMAWTAVRTASAVAGGKNFVPSPANAAAVTAGFAEAFYQARGETKCVLYTAIRKDIRNKKRFALCCESIVFSLKSKTKLSSYRTDSTR